MAKGTETIIDLLCGQANSLGDKPAFIYLKNGESVQESISFSELHIKALTIAARLQALKPESQTALLLYPAGIDFIAAFFGCIYAGIIAIPAIPPRSQRALPNISTIIDDSKTSLVLSNSLMLSKLTVLLDSQYANFTFVSTDDIEVDLSSLWVRPNIDSDSTAFLQYTSGSTSDPKGAIISHRNILHNQKVIRSYFKSSSHDRFMTWLPHYHDMGLIGGIVNPLYSGMTCYVMAPASFIKNPFVWLKAISDYKCTISGAPNFAYQLCVDRIQSEQLVELDLSSWEAAFNGAEPIRACTIEAFIKRFSTCGFSEKAFLPCYGMAEATLMLSGINREDKPMVRPLDRQRLLRDRTVFNHESDSNPYLAVSCGKPNKYLNIKIIDPETKNYLGHDKIGEICVAGESIFKGYYLSSDTSQFYNFKSGKETTSYFCTGDYGFLDQDGHIYVTGRIKDIIIVSGRNYYPQDLELAAASSHKALLVDGCAAFSVDVENVEKVVLVCELSRDYKNLYNFDEIVEIVCQTLFELFDVTLHGFVLIRPRKLPKTTSGKIRRSAVKALYLSNNLESIETWCRPIAKQTVQKVLNISIDENSNIEDIQEWLASRAAFYLELDLTQLEINEPLAYYGMDSTIALQLVDDMTETLGREVDPTILWEHPTIASLSEKISMLINEPELVE